MYTSTRKLLSLVNICLFWKCNCERAICVVCKFNIRLYTKKCYCCLHTAECAFWNKQKKEITIVRTFWGPLVANKDEFRYRGNKDIYENRESEKISRTIRKRRVRFFGCIMRMDSSRLANKFLTVYQNKDGNQWIQKVEMDESQSTFQ